MSRLHSFLLLLVGLLGAPCHAELRLGQTTFEFATISQARQILTNRDDFVRSLSPFDRAARLKTDRDVSEIEFLEYVARQVLPWGETEQQALGSAVKALEQKLANLSLPLPKRVLFIKTSGDEEGQAAYTRANAVIFPNRELAHPQTSLQKNLCHELFHILSRTNPDLREKLYVAIGFTKCGEIAFPPELKARKLTNPDAPFNNHCIKLQVQDKTHWAVPILFSSTEKYDLHRGGEFFQYLQFRLLLVERSADSSHLEPLYQGQSPRLVRPEDVRGFYEQVGRNTGYILHPEEILADNFTLLVFPEGNLPSPEILEKVRRAFKDQ